MAERGAATLEQAFISYLQEAGARGDQGEVTRPRAATLLLLPEAFLIASARRIAVSAFARLFSYTRREAMELRRDPIRATLALLGSVILMVIMGYGISLDVEDLPFAVLDRDQTTTSREYILNLAGSRYFIEHEPITDYHDLDRRMRSGEIESGP